MTMLALSGLFTYVDSFDFCKQQAFWSQTSSELLVLKDIRASFLQYHKHEDQ